jgi:N-methylhydantoinase B
MLPATDKTLDPIQLTIVQNHLVGIAREMGNIMEKASYSSILNEGKDFSCAVFGPDGELVAEGEFVLVHLAAMHEAVQVFIRRFGDTWRPGDIGIHNDPYEGGSHLPDINLVRPVFAGDELSAFVATRAHYPDVGGRVPGSFCGEAATLYDEGVAIPPLRLAREDVIDEQLIELWARNVRVARRLRADLMAQVASVRIGERRVVEACERFGSDVVQAAMRAIPDHGERLMRRRIEARLSGERRLFDFMDDAGPETGPVRIQVAVSAHEGEICFDFTGSDGQVACPVNAPLAVVKSAAFGAVKCALVPELPLTSGMFRPLEVRTELGSVTDPVMPAPVAAGNTNTSMRIFDLCVAALASLAGGEPIGMAGSYSANSDIGMGGTNPRTGEEFVHYMMPVGGIGAAPGLDGESAQINYMGNCASQPVEILEATYPLRVREYRLRPDSGGAGRHRGGLGLLIAIEITGADVETSIFTERQRFAPFGLHRGKPGALGHYELERAGRCWPIETKVSGLRLTAGDVLRIHTPGGGGFGDPSERSIDAIVDDLAEGLISPSAARSHYGVAVDADGNVDREQAERQRAAEAAGDSAARRVVVESISESAKGAIELPLDAALGDSFKDGAVIYCQGEGMSAYACAVSATGGGVRLSRDLADALEVDVGHSIWAQTIGSTWAPAATDQLRRAFKTIPSPGGTDL